MNKIIALPYLAAEMAEKTGVTTDIAEKYVHTLIELVTDALSRGEQIRIKSIGIFTAAPNGDISFTPEASIADTVNAPFAAFEPVELAPEMLINKDIPQEIKEDSPNDESGEIHEPSAASDTTETTAPSETPEIVEQSETTEISDTSESSDNNEESPNSDSSEIAEPSEISESTEDSEPSEFTDTSDYSEPSEFSYDNSVPEKQFPWVWTAIGLICGLIIGFVAGYLMQPKVDQWIVGDNTPAAADSVTTGLVEISKVETPDTIANVLKPVKEVETPVVYDTIRTNRFLTTMARQHYGQMEYWVYIYQENSDILGHPDRAKAGTVVRIPDVKKYATSTSDSVNVQRAIAKAVEIYAPYR